MKTQKNTTHNWFMNDNSNTPVSHLVADTKQPNSKKTHEDLTEDIQKQPHLLVISISSAGRWKYMALANYVVMYFLMGAVIIGDTSDLWHVQVDQAVLATFIGATIGSTIPLYLQFRIGKSK